MLISIFEILIFTAIVVLFLVEIAIFYPKMGYLKEYQRLFNKFMSLREVLQENVETYPRVLMKKGRISGYETISAKEMIQEYLSDVNDFLELYKKIERFLGDNEKNLKKKILNQYSEIRNEYWKKLGS